MGFCFDLFFHFSNDIVITDLMTLRVFVGNSFSYLVFHSIFTDAICIVFVSASILFAQVHQVLTIFRFFKYCTAFLFILVRVYLCNRYRCIFLTRSNPLLWAPFDCVFLFGYDIYRDYMQSLLGLQVCDLLLSFAVLSGSARSS